MTDLHGWSLGGFWAELKFDAKHAKDFRRVAVITGKPLHRFMTSMLKPFTSAEIKCFQQEKKSDALTWRNQDVSLVSRRRGAHCVLTLAIPLSHR
jgi:stage II sporulation SpoAA-like protein